jgi:DNA-binding transcriptional LysR family regulator
MLDLRLLSHALALAEHGSFARAARAVHLSQPALSRSIQSLEGQLGVLVFERGRNGVELTDAGRVILNRARALVGHAEDLEREAGVLQKGNGRALRVAAGPYAARMLVAAAVARCLRGMPDFRVVATVDNWVKVAADVRDRRADIGICESSELDEQDMEIRPLKHHQAHAVARRGHPLDGRQSPNIADILKYPVALSSRIPARVLARLLPSTTTGSLPAIRCENLDIVNDILAQSDAISFMPEVLARREVAAGRLVLLDYAPPWLHTSFAVMRLKEQTHAPEAALFWDAVIAADAALA